MEFNNNGSLLEIINLCTYFYTSEGIVRAVDGLNLSIGKGEAVGLVGETGCGKSMTARSIMQLIPTPPGKIIDGEILYKSQDLLKLSRNKMRKVRGAEISIIFQDPMTFLNPIMTIGNQISESVHLHLGLRGSELRSNVVNALQRARIPSPDQIVDYYPHQLSGGMRQRALIAMAISCFPALLIADEPTTALDVTIQAQILQLLKNIISDLDMSLLLITHDLGVVADICDKVYVMYAGQIVERATTTDLFNNPQHPYTRGLLNAVLNVGQKVAEFEAIEGSVPNLLKPPTGCRFHPRCPHIMNICKKSDPSIMMKNEQGKDVACWLFIDVENQ